jgi:nucleoside-diphosphate-sugar epimerase
MWLRRKKPTGYVGKIDLVAADISGAREAEKAIAQKPDVIFHLAAIVSGEAETDFEKGHRINLEGTHRLFEAVRSCGKGYNPKIVFTSSIAVFGAPFAGAITTIFISLR